MYYPRDNPEGYRFAVNFNPCTQRTEVYSGRGDQRVSTVLVPYELNEAEPAMMKLSDNEAQGLLDALYMAGFRPSVQGPSNGIIEAKDEHIADLRKVLDAHLRDKT